MLSIKNTFETLRTNSALKMLRTKAILGLDISDKQINLALLKSCFNGVELLASASAPVPVGEIKNGNIENAAVLADAIKKLKKENRIRTTSAVVSLFTEPVITQIMGIPKQVPSNIGQFIQDQVKNFAVLPTNNIALDFCRVAGPVRRSTSEGGSGSETELAGRLLVVAADSRKVNEIIKVCGQADITVEAVEPPLLAYTRALFNKKIAGKFDSNVLIVILQANSLTLCVFRKQTIDFVRTKNINKTMETACGEKTQPDEFSLWLAEQINAVIQFYDVEVPDNFGKWDITIVADGTQLHQNTEGFLKAKVANADLQVLTGEDVCNAAVVSQSAKIGNTRQNDPAPTRFAETSKPSPVAVGLAMKLLNTNARNLGVNLLPPEVTRLRNAQKGALITANILAVLLLIMILAVSVPTWKIKNLDKNINYKKTHLLQNTLSLVSQRTSVNEQIDAVKNKLNQITEVLSSHRDSDWPALLKDIRKRIPRTVSLTSLSGGGSLNLSLKGLATSNEDVYWFSDMLSESEYINSASIAQTKKNDKGLISYEIRCSLAPKKEKSDVN
jgi:Tfp pilus assembly PilM family ATPase/Tfp pilus assembly protein PilN